MTISYKLSITDLAAGTGGTVSRVYCVLTGTDDCSGRSQAAQFSVELGEPAEDADFISLDDLTDRRVKAWIKDAPIIADYRERIAAVLADIPDDAPALVSPPWRKP